MHGYRHIDSDTGVLGCKQVLLLINSRCAHLLKNS
jgi:hypothetical protein